MNAKLLVLAAAAAIALPSAAFGLPATVVTDVALRTGPGPAYPVIGTIDRQAIVYQEQRASTVPAGAPIFVGDPIVGPSLGPLRVGTVIHPPPQAQTYVTTHRVDPVYLQGAVVVGAILPRSVVMSDIPQSPYRYTYVNGRTVLVEPTTNQIVHVYR